MVLNKVKDRKMINHRMYIFQDVRRPFTELSYSNEEAYFIHFKIDQVYLKCSRPTWLLGAAFHGPYSKNQDPIRNLKVTLQVENEFLLLLEERVKLCRVKYQACILPIFFLTTRILIFMKTTLPAYVVTEIGYVFF